MTYKVSMHVHACISMQGWLSGASPCPTVVVGVDPALVTTSSSTLKEALSRNLQGPLDHLQLYSAYIYSSHACNCTYNIL